jgi:hypothetical protein
MGEEIISMGSTVTKIRGRGGAVSGINMAPIRPLSLMDETQIIGHGVPYSTLFTRLETIKLQVHGNPCKV